MITAIICSLAIGFLVAVFFFLLNDPFPSPYYFDPVDFERERRIRAENDAMELYRRLENQRIDNIRLRSYPIYQAFDYGWTKTPFEIQKIPRAMSQDEAKEKYGEHYQITDGLIGKLNEVITEVNHLSSKNS